MPALSPTLVQDVVKVIHEKEKPFLTDPTGDAILFLLDQEMKRLGPGDVDQMLTILMHKERI